MGILCMVLGCVTVWAALFGIGSLLYGHTINSAILLVIAALVGVLLMKLASKIQFD